MSTKEPQYVELLHRKREKGIARLGLMSSQSYFDDPKHLAFVLSRYKFVSKMLEGKAAVCEIGCGDGFPAPIVAKAVGRLTAFDFDPAFVEDAKDRTDPKLGIDFRVHDVLSGPIPGGPYDAAYACDVLEHIAPEHEATFLENVRAGLGPDGVLIVGIPSLESQAYASPMSKAGHVNCKSGADFKALMGRYFRNVFLFSMNDEVVHTGFSRMAHYLFTVSCGPRV